MRYSKTSWNHLFKFWCNLSKLQLIDKRDSTLPLAIRLGYEQAFERAWVSYIPDKYKIIEEQISG